jgi:hypothetical protein
MKECCGLQVIGKLVNKRPDVGNIWKCEFSPSTAEMSFFTWRVLFASAFRKVTDQSLAPLFQKLRAPHMRDIWQHVSHIWFGFDMFWQRFPRIAILCNSYVLICFDIAEATESQDSLRTINLRHCRAGVNTLEMCVELLGGASSMTGSRQRLEFCGWFCSSQSHLVLHNLAYFGRRVVLDY